MASYGRTRHGRHALFRAASTMLRQVVMQIRALAWLTARCSGPTNVLQTLRLYSNIVPGSTWCNS